MKKIHLLILFVLSFSQLVAQKITQKKDIILVDGKPYLEINKEDGHYSGIYKVNYKIKTLDQKVIILATASYDTQNYSNNDSHFELTFVETNEKAYLPAAVMGMGKKIAKQLHSNNVITGNTINNEGKKIFLMLYGEKPKNNRNEFNSNNNNSNNNDNLVQRDRNGLIFIFGNRIEQDSKTIGTITDESIAIQGGVNRIYKFYSPDGSMIAEATYVGLDSDECTIVTLKDNHRRRITAKRTAESPKNIVQMLIRDYYL